MLSSHYTLHTCHLVACQIYTQSMNIIFLNQLHSNRYVADITLNVLFWTGRMEEHKLKVPRWTFYSYSGRTIMIDIVLPTAAATIYVTRIEDTL